MSPLTQPHSSTYLDGSDIQVMEHIGTSTSYPHEYVLITSRVKLSDYYFYIITRRPQSMLSPLSSAVDLPGFINDSGAVAIATPPSLSGDINIEFTNVLSRK